MPAAVFFSSKYEGLDHRLTFIIAFIHYVDLYSATTLSNPDKEIIIVNSAFFSQRLLEPELQTVY